MTALRLWLLRALTALLAFAFALPACTAMLWSDNRSLTVTDVTAPPELRAFRLAKEPTAIVLELPPAARAALRVHAPELPDDLQWVRLRPHGSDDAAIVAHIDRACARDARWPLRIVVFRDPPDTPLVWTFEPDLFTYAMFGKSSDVAHLRSATCDVTLLAGRPDDLGEAIPSITLDHAVANDDGTLLVARIALTPVALALDAVGAALFVTAVVVAIPLLPFAWLAHQIAGDK